MTLVRPKSETREAWQYTGQPVEEWPMWVQGCCYQFAEDAIIVRRSGQQIIRSSEWLVRNLDGDPEWLTHDQMRKEYEEVVG